MMKILAVVGTNAPFSYNRFLCQFIAERYRQRAQIKVREIDGIKPFCRTDQADQSVKRWLKDVREADGLIFATPEYDHAIPAALKSALEWLGLRSGPNVLKMKPVCVVGTSYGVQGTAQAQEDAREILLSPDLSANLLPGNEILVGHAAQNFDKKTGQLINQHYIQRLDEVMNNFFQFIAQAEK